MNEDDADEATGPFYMRNPVRLSVGFVRDADNGSAGCASALLRHSSVEQGQVQPRSHFRQEGKVLYDRA
jgi:hypothetical protein